MKYKNRKKGFTLIEIIISIAIIALIGTISIVGFNVSNKISKEKRLEKITSNFTNALQVYIANHSEVENNLILNAKAAAVTLETLKNEGLIKDGIVNPVTNEKFDYEKDYFLLSDAVVLEDKESDSEIACENSQVSIAVFNSWDLSNKTKGEVLYICPKTVGSDTDSNTKELEDRVSKLESALQLMNMGDKNYVIFDVSTKSSLLAYFPNNEYTDIWRIVQNDKGENEFTLMYNQNINSNYKNLFPKVSDIAKVYDNKNNEYWGAASEKDCKEMKNYVAYNVERVRPESLGSYYGFGAYSGSLSRIQGLFKSGSNFYSGGNRKYSYGGNQYCYYPLKKIDDIDTYVSPDMESSKLKNNSPYLEYYFKDKTSRRMDLIFKSDGLEYLSLFDINTTNPFKDALYNGINSKLRGNILKSQNSYLYSLEGGTTLVHLANQYKSNESYFRSLTSMEVEQNKKWLTTYSIPVGLYTPTYYNGISQFNGLEKVSTRNSTSTLYFVYSIYGEKSLVKSNAVSTGSVYYMWGDSSSYGMGTDKNSYYVKTVKYNPVIDLTDTTILNNIDDYSADYKSKRPECTNNDLGSYECPYLLRVGGNYSDGT